jgi:site-specific recombinase XerD
MGRSDRRENASTNKRSASQEAESYSEWLSSQPLAERTHDAYAAVVVAFAAWLDGHGGGLDGPRARDLAARDYKRFLKVERGLGPASVNQALAALDHFFRFLGLGAAIVQREDLPRAAPRALTVEEQRLLLRAAEESSPRDRAIVGLLLFAGLRLSEAAALQLADVRMSARKGVVIVRSGKGDAYREVPLNALVRRLLEEWLEVRHGHVGEGSTAFLLSRTGQPLTKRSVDLAVRRVAGRASLELSAHVLRHSFVTGLIRAGHDVVLVAELAGHRRLETTRRYSLPSAADREAAVADLEVEF